jgi:hypothetical protein
VKRPSHALIVALIAAVVVHLSVAWLDFPTLARNGFLYDDSFYAFQIARSIAEGNGPTFDGTTLTNGFQPLYVLLLVPLYLISGGDSILPIHLALALMAVISVATALVLFLILRRYVQHSVAVAASAFWVVSPIVIRQTANGLETALSLFLFALCVYYYLSRIRDADRPLRSHVVRLGLMLGLAVLARLDLVFLVLAIALDYLVRERRTGGGARAAANAAWMIGAAFLVYLPWLAYGVIAVGRVIPESGTATRFLSLAYAPFFGVGSADLINTGPDGSFVWAHVTRAISVLKLTPFTHALFRTIERLTSGTAIGPAAKLAGNVLGVAMLGAVAVWAFLRSRDPGRRAVRELSFLLLFSVSLMAAYALYVFGVFFFIRYLYPVYFVAMIFGALLLHDAVGLVRRFRPKWRVAIAAICVVYAAGHLYMGFNCCYRSAPVYHFYDIARWVEENTSEDETIGVFQSGAIGYLSTRKVVNLDGKVNGDALSALQEGRLNSYVDGAGIDVLLDHTTIIELFLGDAGNSRGQPCFSGRDSGLPGWIGYRLSAGGASSPAPASRVSIPTR